MKATQPHTPIDYRSLVTFAPDLYLILSPALDILDASDAYLSATLTQRTDITGKYLFDIFPDNPADAAADGVDNLRLSLMTVLSTRLPHKMQVQKYDIRKPDGTFEERYWSPLNTPVPGEQGEVAFIIHRVEDVTELAHAKKAIERQQLRQTEIVQIHEQNLQESENRFRTIFNLNPVALFITNAADGRLKYVNEAFERLFHFNSKDAIGKTVIELGIIDSDNRAQLAQHVHDEGGHSVEMEIEVHTANGDARQVFLSTEAIDVDGQECFLKAMVDITERKTAAQRLQATNRFLDNILENMPSMVLVRDAKDLKLIRMNKAAEEMLGVGREELLGKGTIDILPAEDAALYAAQDRLTLTIGGLQQMEEQLKLKSGSKWLYTRKIPVYENGMPQYLLSISQDTTDKKNQQDAILELNKELEAFSYSVAHDLRAPLRAITGFAKILESDLGSEVSSDILQQLRKISSNAENMGCLIDDLLMFSKLGKKSLRPENVNMNQLVDWAIAEIAKTGEIRAEINVEKLPPVKADFMLLCQVMINLLSNAIKYSSKKDHPVVNISGQVQGKECIYTISDNGTGFDMRYSNKLFGVFQRLHRADEFEGSGVGLAIVQRIVTKHQGRVWADAKPNEGARFSFSLPAT